MTEFAGQLLQACLCMLDRSRQTRSHPFTYPGASVLFVRCLKEATPEGGEVFLAPDQWSDLLEKVRRGGEVLGSNVVGFNMENLPEFVRLVTSYYGIVQPEGEGYRVTTRARLSNRAMYAGDEMMSGSDVQLLDRFAHNHLLAFPEIFRVFQVVGRDARPTSAVKALKEEFYFVRKMNATTVDYIVRELTHLKVAQENGEVLEIRRLPASAIAHLLVEAYLTFSEYQVDVAVSSEDVYGQLAFIVKDPETTLQGRWDTALRPQMPLMRLEVGGTCLRMSPESLVWLTEHGMVEPATVAKILRRQSATAMLKKLADRMQGIVSENSPQNQRDYLSNFN